MQEILKGQKCFLGIDVTQVGAVQNAVKIDTHIISPSGVVSCVANGYDELKKVVGLIISADLINELGAYSIDLRLVFADAVIVVPTFAFAEAVEGEAPCYGISEVYVKIEGGEVVPSGSTTVEFVNREEFEQLSNKVDDLEERIGSGGGGSITIDTELSDTSDNAIANSAVAKALNSKQDTLTLTTKPNGNIIIGNLAGQSKEFMPATPSGDPMHYAYEAEGAVWNANTGYWEMYDMKDVTNEQMRRSYNFGHFSPSDQGVFCIYSSLSPANIRFNLPRTGNYNATLSYFVSFAAGNWAIEVLNLTQAWNVIGTYANIGEASSAFLECTNLRRVMGILNLSSASNIATMFKGCPKLEDVQLLGLKANISFADSQHLSNESILYMIENANATTAITITLHEDAYMSAMENDDIVMALAEKTNVKLASA